ncbi:hypothetical protein D3C87_1837360 [compost metagenome]
MGLVLSGIGRRAEAGHPTLQLRDAGLHEPGIFEEGLLIGAQLAPDLAERGLGVRNEAGSRGRLLGFDSDLGPGLAERVT